MNGSNPARMSMTSGGRVPITPQLVLGVLILLFGILLTLDRLNIVDAAYAFRVWPVVLIAFGGWLLTRHDDHKARFWGWVWVFIGSWLLLRTLGLIRIGFFDLFWPIVLIAIGVAVIRQTLGYSNRFGDHRSEPRGPSGSPASAPFVSQGADIAGGSGHAGASSSATGGVGSGAGDGVGSGGNTTGGGKMALFAALGGTKRSLADNPFRGGEMTSLLGGCHLDLRQATIPPGDEATINVFGIMGGHEIWVPSTWSVVSQIAPILGGVDDRRLPESLAAGAAAARPRLVLRGLVIMGGVVIRS